MHQFISIPLQIVTGLAIGAIIERTIRVVVIERLKNNKPAYDYVNPPKRRDNDVELP